MLLPSAPSFAVSAAPAFRGADAALQPSVPALQSAFRAIESPNYLTSKGPVGTTALHRGWVKQLRVWNEGFEALDAEEAALASHGSPLVAVLNAFMLRSSIPLLHSVASHTTSPANPAQQPDPQAQLPISAAKAFPWGWTGRTRAQDPDLKLRRMFRARFLPTCLF